MFRTGSKHDPAPAPQREAREAIESGQSGQSSRSGQDSQAGGTPEQPRMSWAPQEDAMQDRGPRSTPADAQLNALLGRGSEFDGKLSFEGTVRIDGTFTGEISTSDTLIVGEGAKVSADITCGSIVVHGDVTGNIKASESVELHRPAKLKGDVTTPSLMVEKGVTFDGSSKMETSSGASNLVTIGRHEQAAEA